MADLKTARIGTLESALEHVEQMSAERIKEVSAVLRLARTALPGGTLPGGPAGDVADGIGAALRLLTNLEGAVYGAITAVHECGPS